MSYEVVQVEHERNFSILDNSAARNPRLSLAARGLLWTLRSLPPGARTDSTSIAESCETKRDGTRTAFDLLEREGYVRRERVQGTDGKWRSTLKVSELPILDVSAGHTGDGFSGAGKTDAGESGAKDSKDGSVRINTPPTPPKGGDGLDRLTAEHQTIVRRVFEAWKATDPDGLKHHPKPSRSAVRKIMARIKDGMSEHDITLAVTAWVHDSWPDRVKHRGIPTLLMNDDKAREWAELGRKHEAEVAARKRKHEPVDWDFYRRKAAERHAQWAKEEADVASGAQADHAASSPAMVAAAGGDIWQ